MKQVPLAKDVLNEHYPGILNSEIILIPAILTAMKEYAKLHREAILETVAEKAEVEEDYDWHNARLKGYRVDKESIKESYPVENIK